MGSCGAFINKADCIRWVTSTCAQRRHNELHTHGPNRSTNLKAPGRGTCFSAVEHHAWARCAGSRTRKLHAQTARQQYRMYIYIYMRVCYLLCVYMYTYIYICICIHIYRLHVSCQQILALHTHNHHSCVVIRPLWTYTVLDQSVCNVSDITNSYLRVHRGCMRNLKTRVN